MKINDDGSVNGQKFSEKNYEGEYPSPRSGETFSSYRRRVDKCKEKGFHLGDLSWGDWQTYCMGSGQFEGVDSENRI